MDRLRSTRRWILPGIALFFLLAFLPVPAAADCAPENCWVCTWVGVFGTSCAIANSADGRLCCDERLSVDRISTYCLLSGDYCYGIIVRDI